MPANGNPPRAVVWDKDGTLLDFARTWYAAVGHALHTLDEDVRRPIAAAIEFDLATSQFPPHAAFVHKTADETAERLAPHIDPQLFFDRLLRAVGETLTPTPGIPELLDHLHGRGVPMAVATNDRTDEADRHLNLLGWSHYFQAVVGYDAVSTPKPAGDMVTQAAARCGVRSSEVIMVGDTQADVDAARAAGATAVLLAPEPGSITGYHYHAPDTTTLGLLLGGTGPLAPISSTGAGGGNHA